MSAFFNSYTLQGILKNTVQPTSGHMHCVHTSFVGYLTICRGIRDSYMGMAVLKWERVARSLGRACPETLVECVGSRVTDPKHAAHTCVCVCVCVCVRVWEGNKPRKSFNKLTFINSSEPECRFQCVLEAHVSAYCTALQWLPLYMNRSTQHTVRYICSSECTYAPITSV